MAINIKDVEIISDSRELKNISSIDNTTITTFSQYVGNTGINIVDSQGALPSDPPDGTLRYIENISTLRIYDSAVGVWWTL